MSISQISASARQKGFTIVEILLAMTIAAILIGSIFTVTFHYYVQAVQSQETALLALESQTILSQMVEDLRLADGISGTSQLTDTYAPVGGWVTNDPSNIIIIKSPAINSTRDIIYDPGTGSPYKNEFIYFISGKNMYKRILKNTTATGNIAKTTCPAAQATASCPKDREFSTNVSNLTFTFYDANNVTTADPAIARSVKLTVGLSKKVFGKDITLSNATQITQRNL